MVAMTPTALPAVNTIIYTASYDFSKLSTGTDTLGGVTYRTVHYDGLYNDGAPGMPSLPVDYIRFSVPWNATNFTVSTTLQNSMINNAGSLLVYPCQPYWFMDDTTQHPITLPDSSAYYSNSYYPAQNAWVVDEGFLAGENHIITVAVMPVSYKHSKVGNVIINNLRKSQTVRLTISYELSDSLAMYPIVRQDTVLRQKGYRLAQSMVVNSNSVESFAPIEMTMNPDVINPNLGGDGLNGGEVTPPDPGGLNTDTTSWYGGELDMASKCDYLIVTTADLYHSTRGIAALKRQEGYDVSVVTMEDVLNSPYSLDGDRIEHEDGSYKLTYTDNAGKLRQYLKYMFKMGTQYVFLVGDSVPYRKIALKTDSAETLVNIQSDLYFSDLNSDWSDTTVFFNKDRAPELYVGRLLASSTQEVQNNSDKLLRYELNPGKGDRSYLQRAFFFEGSGWFTGRLDIARDTLSSFFPNQIYMFDIEDTPNPIKGNDVIDALNTNHVGFMTILNHGAPNSIKVHEGTSHYPLSYYIYANRDISSGDGLNCLRNKHYPTIFYALCCKTMPFDYVGINCGKSFTTGKDYGGPVYIGHTRTVNSLFLTGCFNFFAEELKAGYYKLGEAVSISKFVATMACAFYTLKSFFHDSLSQGYLGDPSLELWTGMPQDYTNISITRGNGSITVSGIGVDSTTVSICGNSTADISLAKRNYLTNFSITISNISPNCLVMLHKHNMIPYIAPLVMQNETLKNSQYVIASDVTAGRSVDSDRTYGDVTVKSGIEYEIEASGTVTLEDGFNVEKGATFAVYPSCF